MSSIFYHRNIFYLILAFYLAAPKWVAHHALQLSQWFPSKWYLYDQCLTFHKWLAKLGNILSPGKMWWNSWVESSDKVTGWTISGSAFWSFSKATPLTGSWSACLLSVLDHLHLKFSYLSRDMNKVFQNFYAHLIHIFGHLIGSHDWHYDIKAQCLMPDGKTSLLIESWKGCWPAISHKPWYALSLFCT